MKWKSAAALSLIIVLGGSMAVYAGSENGEKVTVNYLWRDTDENVEAEMEFVEQMLPEVLPDIEVNMEGVPGDAETYETKIRTMIAAGGEGIDAWEEIGGSWFTPILESESALPLNDYLDASGYWDKVIAPVKNTAEGTVYCIPCTDSSYEIMLYNKKIFADNGLEVPKTVDELKAVVEKLTQTDIVPISVGAKDGWCAVMMVEGFAYSIDPEITRKVVEGEAKFSDEPYAKGAQVVKELLDMGAFSKNVALTGIDEALPLFESGKAAMMANGSWAVSTGAAKMGDDFGWFYYPAVNEEDVDKLGVNVAGGLGENAGLMVYAGTEHPDEAAAVCEAIAELRCQFAYEEQGDPFRPYKADVMGWNREGGFAEPVQQLADDMANFQFVYGLVQDVMPTAAASSGVMEATSKFMTNTEDYTVDDYLADMDKAALEE